LPSGIAAFDCVEFSAELRNIDVISDIAFLFMDLVARARQDLAAVFLNRYLERTGDYAGMQVFGLYYVYHCMIRAKVAAIRSAEREDAAQHADDVDELKRNLAVAGRWIDRRPPRLIAMHGYSGSGKTWLSSQLLAKLPAIRLRSDIERKRLLKLAESSDVNWLSASGRYTQRARAEIYQSLFESADILLQEGLNVIIDASFLRKADRKAATALAIRREIPIVFVETHARDRELITRLARRKAAGRDASEADIDVLRYQVASADALTDHEMGSTVRIATDDEVDTDSVVKRVLAVMP
jgi:predicted kinase